MQWMTDGTVIHDRFAARAVEGYCEVLRHVSARVEPPLQRAWRPVLSPTIMLPTSTTLATSVIINFDLNDLQAFRAVVDKGSFSGAAEAIRISQPALSRRIEKLESALDVKLFERTTRRVSLTMVGRAFLPQVERILDDLDIALMGISNVASTRMGNVTIACVPSTAYYFMPHVISEFHKLYPKIRIRVLDASAGEVCNAVESGEADFGVSFSGSLADEVEFELLLQERYVLACRRDHPLAGRVSVPWAEAYEMTTSRWTRPPATASCWTRPCAECG